MGLLVLQLMPALGSLEVSLQSRSAPGGTAPASRRRRRHTHRPGTSYTAGGSREAPTSAIASEMLTTAQPSHASAAVQGGE